MVKYCILSLSLVVCCACTIGPAKTYKGKSLSKKEIGKVVSIKKGKWFPHIIGYRKGNPSSNEYKSLGNAVTGYPLTLYTEPGIHSIRFKCDSDSKYVLRSLDIQIERGKTYRVECKKNSDIIEAFVADVSH